MLIAAMHHPITTVKDLPATWQCIVHYETGGQNVSNKWDQHGYFQIAESTWLALGYKGSADRETLAGQFAVAKQIWAIQGWNAWPESSRACGLYG